MYNISPSQNILTVVQNEQGQAEARNLRWGFVPSWMAKENISSKFINARIETAAEKPMFRDAYRKRHCLIVADGFYEWKKLETKKQPYYFQLKDKQPFAFAGLWEEWQSPENEKIASCTIVTTEANELLQPIHNRMPVILQQSDYEKWLDPQLQKTELLEQLLHPFEAEKMTKTAVSTKVNNPSYTSAECITPQREKS